MIGIILILGVLIIWRFLSIPKEKSAGQEENDLQDDVNAQVVDDETTEEAENELAPDFELETVNGGMAVLSDFRGKPVLLNFWATWCPPCIQEMPLIQQTADQYSDELIVLAVNGGDSMDLIRSFARANEYDLNFLANPENDISVIYKVQGFPTTFFIDSEGFIQAKHIGMLDENIISYYLEKIGVME